MGCDIHATFQKYVDGRWVQFGDDDSMYIGRNYFLFSVLADVRNYSEIVPISKPKGFPKDYEGDLIGHWEYDGHSRSWLTLQEILSYDWTKKIHCIDYTNKIKNFNWYMYRNTYDKYNKFSEMDLSYPKENTYIISEEHYKIFKEDIETTKTKFDLDELSKNCMIKFTNSTNYANRINNFFTGVILDMIKESGGDFNSVRMVFCFDN
jgi:hypothetical protein